MPICRSFSSILLAPAEGVPCTDRRHFSSITSTMPTPSSAAASRPTIFYPIGNENESKGGAIITFGTSSSSRIVLLSAGYPDDHETFLPFAERLAKEADCCCGVTCLAGFDDRPQDGRPWTAHNKDGYTFDEMAAGLRDAGRALRASSTCRSAVKFTVIFHDWAVPPGMIYINKAIDEAKLGAETGDVPDGATRFVVQFCGAVCGAVVPLA